MLADVSINCRYSALVPRNAGRLIDLLPTEGGCLGTLADLAIGGQWMPGNAGWRVDYCRYRALVPRNLGRLIDLLPTKTVDAWECWLTYRYSALVPRNVGRLIDWWPTKTVDAWECWLTCRLLSIQRVGA